MDICHLFPQHVQAIIPLIGGVQMRQCPVLGFLVAVVAHVHARSMWWVRELLVTTPGARVGGVLPPESTCREKACSGGSHPSPRAPPKQWHLSSKVAWACSTNTLSCSHTRLQPLQAVFTQPTPVLSLGLISEAWASAPSPNPHQQMHISGWGVQGGGTDCAGLCPFWLLKTGCCILLWGSEALSQLISLLVRGLPRVREPFSQLLPRREVPSWFLSHFLFFFFLLSYLVTWRFSCPFKSLRSSASIQ